MSLGAQDFITVKDGQFIKEGKPYYYIGTNFWYGMHLGAFDKDRLIRELNRLENLGIKNLRVMASSEGPDNAPWRMQPALMYAPGTYNMELLQGIDFLLEEMKKRGMVAVMCLNNFWPWSGGMAQYINWVNKESIPYPPPAAHGNWLKYQRYSASFYQNKPAVALYYNHIREIVNRANTISGTPYKNDPTIMAWQLANEPEGAGNVRKYRKWIRETAKFIKTLDSNHLVSIGSEGNTASSRAGTNFEKDHKSKYIDYCTMHIWVQNWGWYDPEEGERSLLKAKKKTENYLLEHLNVANKLNKPMVLEEFGIARDQNDHNPEASTVLRDRYYDFLFAKVVNLAGARQNMAGANFWAWGGEGRPREPHSLWKLGDDFIGDPPHEYQGWYSVYDEDTSTQQVIARYVKAMDEIEEVKNQQEITNQ